jgi:hypothetical protein
MSATVVQFPTGSAHPAARRSRRDKRVLALIERHLKAERAIHELFDRFTRSGVDTDDSPEAQAEIQRDSNARCRLEDQLAKLAESDNLISEWLKLLGDAVENSRWRRERHEQA